MTVGPFRRNLRRKVAVNSLARSVSIVIMPTVMNRLLPALLLTLGACVPPTLGGDSQPPNASSAGQTTQGPQSPTVNTPNTASTSGSAAARPLAMDTSNRFEYADVYVSMGDATGMRALVPYLMKPESWMLVKCEMLTPTYKHYRFQKVSTGDGRATPEGDIFKARR